MKHRIKLLLLFVTIVFQVKCNNIDTTGFNNLVKLAYQNEKDSNFSEAIEYFTKAQDISSDKSSNINTDICAKLSVALGNLLYNTGNYTKAMEVYIKGIECSERNKNSDKTLLNGLYLNTAVIYSTFEDHEQALIYYQKGYKNAIELNNKALQFNYLNNMVASACYANDLIKARDYSKAAQEISEVDSIYRQFIYLFNCGFISLAEGKDLAAMIYFNKALDFVDDHSLSPRFKAGCYSELFKAYENSNLPDSAISYLHKCRIISKEHKYVNMLIESYKGLARVYGQLNDSINSFYYQDEYVQLSDSLMNMREFYKVRNKQITYEDNKNKSYVELLTTKISTQKNILSILITFLIIFTSLIILIYLQKNRLQKSYYNLYNKSKELIQIERRYNDALNEVSHLKEALKKDQQTINESIVYETEPLKHNLLSDDQKQQLLKKIMDVMNTPQEYSNPEFSLAILANLVDSNTKYVSQIINETYEKNFRAFINEYRIKESIKMLIDTDNYGHYSIKGIAESVGYKSQSNFIDAFRKNTGITPSIYQKMAKEKQAINIDT